MSPASRGRLEAGVAIRFRHADDDECLTADCGRHAKGKINGVAASPGTANVDLGILQWLQLAVADDRNRELPHRLGVQRPCKVEKYRQ